MCDEGRKWRAKLRPGKIGRNMPVWEHSKLGELPVWQAHH